MLKIPYNSSGRRKKWIIMDGLWLTSVVSMGSVAVFSSLRCFVSVGQARVTSLPRIQYSSGTRSLGWEVEARLLHTVFFIYFWQSLATKLCCIFTNKFQVINSLHMFNVAEKNIVHNSLTVYLIYFKVEIVLKQHNGQTDTIWNTVQNVNKK